jgi:indole-3-glycerol phosphate synthase
MDDSILDRIVASVTARLEAEPVLPELERRARQAVEKRRDRGLRSLRAALAADRPVIIAECKQASPSAGVLRPSFDAVALARTYAMSGASAVSVVTEPEFFKGDIGWLSAIRPAVDLPLLRKDFIADERQLFETALAGADAVLLIQRILDPGHLSALLELAGELELEVLLEVFADEDPAPAVNSGASIIGVNARDLATFEVDLERVAALSEQIPSDRARVAESGIRGRQDMLKLWDAGYDAFLVGEHLVRSDDPGASLRSLLGSEGC